jgi:hypothetical protein
VQEHWGESVSTVSGFGKSRAIVTGFYVILVFFGGAAQGAASFPSVVLALTASYGILILLLWLHEKWPPTAVPQATQRDRASG